MYYLGNREWDNRSLDREIDIQSLSIPHPYNNPKYQRRFGW